MRKLIVFGHVSLDGYFVDAKGEMTWAHRSDPEWNAFAAENAGGGGELLFGRMTYDMMASWWPSPQAMQMMPAVAKAMNEQPKVVFSRTLERAAWQNTRLMKGDLAGSVRKLKGESGPGMVILGSGSIVAQLAQAGLIDEFHLVVNPIILGGGRTLFDGVAKKLQFKLLRTRSFANGNVVTCYERVG